MLLILFHCSVPDWGWDNAPVAPKLRGTIWATLGWTPGEVVPQRTRALQLGRSDTPGGDLVPRPSPQLALKCPPAPLGAEALGLPARASGRERALAPMACSVAHRVNSSVFGGCAA
jgi:hypothetical protein